MFFTSKKDKKTFINNNYNLVLTLMNEKQDSKTVKTLIDNKLPIPAVGNEVQCNGIVYVVKKIRYHVKDGFSPYIELFVEKSEFEKKVERLYEEMIRR